MAVDKLEEDILRALRQITRAIDLHSRYLSNTFGLTGPQLVCLRLVNQSGAIAPSRVADQVALSQATVTGIIDRLANRQLVNRERSTKDRRVVTVTVTEAGKQLIKDAPSPLQESFTTQLALLPQEKQWVILDTLKEVARMMGGDQIAAAPVLTTSPATFSAEEDTKFVDFPSTDGSLDDCADEIPSNKPSSVG